MKPFGTRQKIMDGVDDARAELADTAQCVRGAAILGMLAFAFISVVALVALARTNRQGP